MLYKLVDIYNEHKKAFCEVSKDIMNVTVDTTNVLKIGYDATVDFANRYRQTITDEAKLAACEPPMHTVSKSIKTVGKATAKAYCTKMNTIQIFGYEIANIALMANEATNNLSFIENNTYQAATAFFAGSLFIMKDKNPAFLLNGGAFLTLGGGLLYSDGYYLTGASVVVASLELSRTGLKIMDGYMNDNHANASLYLKATHKFVGEPLRQLYAKPVEAICSKFNKFGDFVNERGALTGAIIKIPMRTDFIIQNAGVNYEGTANIMQ